MGCLNIPTHLLVAAPVGDGVVQIVATGGHHSRLGGHGAELALVRGVATVVVLVVQVVLPVVRLQYLCHDRPLPLHLAAHLRCIPPPPPKRSPSGEAHERSDW